MDSIKEIKSLFSKVLRYLSVWGSDSFFKSAIILFLIFIVGWPLIQFFQSLVWNYPYLKTINNIKLFLFEIKTSTYLIIFLFLLCFFFIYKLYIKYKDTKIVKDNFTKGLSRWAIPQGSGWTIQESIDYEKLGKMLSVSNSFFPGILKEAYTWYDYNMEFKILIPKEIDENNQNFSFIVRAEDNYNGIMFQVSKTYLQPYLLYDSAYIRDGDNYLPLPTILKTNTWINVKVRVSGDEITLFINDFKLNYKIHSYIFSFVRKDLLSQQPINLSDLKKSTEEMESAIKGLTDAQKLTDNVRKRFEIKKAQEKLDKYIEAAGPTGFAKVIIEYQKGTVGFVESGNEKIYVKDFILKKI